MKSAQEYYEGLEDKPDFTELTKTGIKSNLGNVWDFADSFAQSKIPVLSFSGEAKTIEILTAVEINTCRYYFCCAFEY